MPRPSSPWSITRSGPPLHGRIPSTGPGCSATSTPARRMRSRRNWVFRARRLRNPGRLRANRNASRAACANGGGNGVLPTNNRLCSNTMVRTSAEPRMAPPYTPNALLSVIVRIRRASSTPSNSALPRPCSPSTPAPCASSTNSHPFRGNTRAYARSGATDPSCANMPSVRTSGRADRPIRLTRLARSSASRCPNRVTRHPKNNAASNNATCARASINACVTRPANPWPTAKSVTYPLDINTADSTPNPPANSRSSCSYTSRFPVVRRDAATFTPHCSAPRWSARRIRPSHDSRK